MSTKPGQLHFSQPTDLSIRVWRYFPWTRFRDALRGRNLWFARADELKMKDPCEGTRTRSDAEAIAAVKPAFEDSGKRAEWIRAMAAMRRRDEEARKSTFISCWQTQDHDMMSMWERYCVNPRIGIAVRTTYDRLDSAVPLEYAPHTPIMIGEMRYGEDRTDLGNHYSLFMNKRVHYADEREIRLLFTTNQPVEAKGLLVRVDWSRLVEQVVVSSYAAENFANAVRSFRSDQGFDFAVFLSEARDPVTPFTF